MSDDPVVKAKKRREAKNEELLMRMRAGENLAAIDMKELFFPRRPPIKKDPRELERIFGKDAEEKKK